MDKRHKIRNNEIQMQFELEEGKDMATLVYRYYKKDIAFVHTYVPDSMKGKGIASALAEVAFKFANEKNKLVMVYCPFVARYVKSHPEVKEQLSKEYHH